MYYGDYGDGPDNYYYGEEGYEEPDYGAGAAMWPTEPVHCVNGPTCKFFALGVCRFYHPETEDDGAEEAWEEGAEDWHAWEEPAPEEPAVYRMVVPSSSTPAPKQPNNSASNHRWNVLVNSQTGSQSVVTTKAATRSASRSPRRKRTGANGMGGDGRAAALSAVDESRASAPSTAAPLSTAPVSPVLARAAAAVAVPAPAAFVTTADTARRQHRGQRAAVLREAPQYILQERYEPLEPPPGVF